MNCRGKYLDLQEMSKKSAKKVTHEELLNQEGCACVEVMRNANNILAIKLEGKIALRTVCLNEKLIN
jgi:hypothetical protein